MDDDSHTTWFSLYTPQPWLMTRMRFSVSELCFSSPFIAFDIPSLHGASDARTICISDLSAAPPGLCPFVYAPKHATKAMRSKLVLFS
jgi:hypothetical protein